MLSIESQLLRHSKSESATVLLARAQKLPKGSPERQEHLRAANQLLTELERQPLTGTSAPKPSNR